MVTVSKGKHWRGPPLARRQITLPRETKRPVYYVVQAQYQREPCLHLVVAQRIFTRGGPINPYLLHHTYLHTRLAPSSPDRSSNRNFSLFTTIHRRTNNAILSYLKFFSNGLRNPCNRDIRPWKREEDKKADRLPSRNDIFNDTGCVFISWADFGFC